MEAGLALALCAVISCNTLRISSTEESPVANISTLGSSIGIDGTILSDLAIVIGQTLRFFHANVILAELEVWTCCVRFAGGLADVLNTQLVCKAVSRVRADRATDSIVATRSSWALIVVTAVLDLRASEKWISSCSRLT